MLYCISDIHGEYDLFCTLLEKIKFSDSDTLFICGDMIDKGEQSVKLLKSVSAMPNVKCVAGNHEYNFLKYYWALMRDSPSDFDKTLAQLQKYFPFDGNLLDWETVDWLESLPFYIEREDFICVHAGVPLDEYNRLQPLSAVRAEQLVYDRVFKNVGVIPQQSKCVIFGHTPTCFVEHTDKIIKYKRDAAKSDENRIGNYCKIHIDTGAYVTGVLGCMRINDCAEFYVNKRYRR